MPTAASIHSPSLEDPVQALLLDPLLLPRPPFSSEKWFEMLATFLSDTWGLPHPQKYLLQWREPAVPPVRGCGPWHTLRAAGILWPLTFSSSDEAWREACRRDPPEMDRNYAGRVEQRYDWRVKRVSP